MKKQTIDYIGIIFMFFGTFLVIYSFSSLVKIGAVKEMCILAFIYGLYLFSDAKD